MIYVASRYHGIDLYNEQYPGGREPAMEQRVKLVDAHFFICEEGREYFKQHFLCHEKGGCRLIVNRLGQKKVDPLLVQTRYSEFHLVSCSSCIELKRLDLIIKALSTIRDIPIRWTHFGDGELFSVITQLAHEMLDSHPDIHYELKGFLPNDRIIRYYCENRIDCFINVSMSEGLPVSIMEALMFGIPVIATDVGGVREMIPDEKFLLKRDCTYLEISQKIKELVSLKDNEIEIIRKKSADIWSKNFDLDVNLEQFKREIHSIFPPTGQGKTKRRVYMISGTWPYHPFGDFSFREEVKTLSEDYDVTVISAYKKTKNEKKA